jgi:hypothetical protein
VTELHLLIAEAGIKSLGYFLIFVIVEKSKKLATLGTQDIGQRLEKTERPIKNGQSNETGNIG